VTTESPGWLEPDWPAPASIRVLSTLRHGGVSTGPFASLNLARHVGDDDAAVRENRRRLAERAALPAEPLWLEQVHGREVIRHDDAAAGRFRADASVAFASGQVCAVMTADCLPVVFADRTATRIAVSHAGWRGLAGGVLEATIDALAVPPDELLAWLGPAISQPAFEVGSEVRDAFLALSPEFAEGFAANARSRYQADLYVLARLALARAGVTRVHGGGWCTVRDADRFFSFRRDGTTGRMATLAWLA
jgi:YfiH family protein